MLSNLDVLPAGSLWAIRLPDLRSTPPLLPHLHILPGARDAGKDLRPDRRKLPTALRGRDDGHGHGHGQAHRAGLLGRGKHQLKGWKGETELGWDWVQLGMNRVYGPDSKHFIFWHVYRGLSLYSYSGCGAIEVLRVCDSVRVWNLLVPLQCQVRGWKRCD